MFVDSIAEAWLSLKPLGGFRRFCDRALLSIQIGTVRIFSSDSDSGVFRFERLLHSAFPTAPFFRRRSIGAACSHRWKRGEFFQATRLRAFFDSSACCIRRSRQPLFSVAEASGPPVHIDGNGANFFKQLGFRCFSIRALVAFGVPDSPFFSVAEASGPPVRIDGNGANFSSDAFGYRPESAAMMEAIAP